MKSAQNPYFIQNRYLPKPDDLPNRFHHQPQVAQTFFPLVTRDVELAQRNPTSLSRTASAVCRVAPHGLTRPTGLFENTAF